MSWELATAEIATPEYWCSCAAASEIYMSMQTLDQQGYEVFVEIRSRLVGDGSPMLVRRSGSLAPQFVSRLRGWQQILQSLGALYVRGVPVDWLGFDRLPHRLLQLPTYPFQRQRYWATLKMGTQKQYLNKRLKPRSLTF